MGSPRRYYGGPATTIVLGATIGLVLLGGGVAGGELATGVQVRPASHWGLLRADGREAPRQRSGESVHEFDVGRIKCLRYCVEGRTVGDEAPRALHAIWNLTKTRNLDRDSTAIPDNDEILKGKTIVTNDLENLQKKCTFSIVMGCEVSRGTGDNLSEIEKNYIKSLQPNLGVLEKPGDIRSSSLRSEIIVERRELANRTYVEFDVEPDKGEISIVVLGDVDEIDLTMPIVATTATTTSRAPELTLAVVARLPRGANGGVGGADGGSRLSVANPPPGGWRLGIEGRRGGAGGRGYQLIVTSGPWSRRAGERASLGYGRGASDENADVAEEYDEIQDVEKEAGIASRSIDVFDANGDPGVYRHVSERVMSDELLLEQEDEQKPFVFPPTKDEDGGANSNNKNNKNNITMRMDRADIENRILERDAYDLEDLNRSINDELPMKKHLIVEINPNTNLIAHPGSIHRVSFDVTNNHILTIRHYLIPRSSPLRIVDMIPRFRIIEIPPGQTATVNLDIQVPPTIMESVVNKVSLQVQGIESVEKSADLYIRTSGSRLYDDIRPTVSFYFNNNCAGRTSPEKCLKSYWSVDITAQDSHSGLKSVTSIPKGVYPRSQYVSGTTSPVYFYYASNCCNRVIEVTATDLVGNVYSRRIDVAEWYNLSEGETAAVVVGVLFIILLIILIVLSILYCCKRRESRDLSYSQRYGSRTAPRTD